jgi:hypothetical protein
MQRSLVALKAQIPVRLLTLQKLQQKTRGAPLQMQTSAGPVVPVVYLKERQGE